MGMLRIWIVHETVKLFLCVKGLPCVFWHYSYPQVEVADRKNKVVNLGSGHVGDVIKRQIPIVNNSLAPISFQLLLLSSSPATKLMGQLTVTPKETISLAACGGTTNVDVFFKPKARIPNFSEEVSTEIEAVVSLFMCVCTCACARVEVK